MTVSEVQTVILYYFELYLLFMMNYSHKGCNCKIIQLKINYERSGTFKTRLQIMHNININ